MIVDEVGGSEVQGSENLATIRNVTHSDTFALERLILTVIVMGTECYVSLTEYSKHA